MEIELDQLVSSKEDTLKLGIAPGDFVSSGIRECAFSPMAG